MAVVRLVAATALGLFIAWLWTLWRGQFENSWVAFSIWAAVCIAISAIYDLRARSHRSNPEPPLLDQSQKNLH